jgi:hypothetical protein
MAQRGRPPIVGAKPPENGVSIRPASDGEKQAATSWKKETAKTSYEVFPIQRDGKRIIKVYRLESRKGATDRRLVYQLTAGKPVCQAMTREQLIKEGVDPEKLK